MNRVVVALLVALGWRGRNLDRRVLIASVLALASLGAPTSFSYYLAFAIPICAAVLGSPDGLRIGGSSNVLRSALAAALCASLSPILVPFVGRIDTGGANLMIVGSLFPFVATTMWLVFVVHATLLAIRGSSGGVGLARQRVRNQAPVGSQA